MLRTPYGLHSTNTKQCVRQRRLLFPFLSPCQIMLISDDTSFLHASIAAYLTFQVHVGQQQVTRSRRCLSSSTYSPICVQTKCEHIIRILRLRGRDATDWQNTHPCPSLSQTHDTRHVCLFVVQRLRWTNRPAPILISPHGKGTRSPIEPRVPDQMQMQMGMQPQLHR